MGGGGGGMYANHRSHDQHYITSYIAIQSQMVQGQHTGNIKCIMGQVTWCTSLDTPRHTHPWTHPHRHTLPGHTPPLHTHGYLAGSMHPTGMLFLPPTMKLGQGYVFTRVCDSVHGGVCLCACWDTPPGGDPLEQTPPGRDPPGRHQEHPPHTPRRTPPQEDTPGSSARFEIWVTSGRYASYWNAYFLYLCLFDIIVIC